MIEKVQVWKWKKWCWEVKKMIFNNDQYAWLKRYEFENHVGKWHKWSLIITTVHNWKSRSLEIEKIIFRRGKYQVCHCECPLSATVLWEGWTDNITLGTLVYCISNQRIVCWVNSTVFYHFISLYPLDFTIATYYLSIFVGGWVGKITTGIVLSYHATV